MICRDLQVPDNGMVSYSDTTVPRAVGSTGTYSCDTEYAFKVLGEENEGDYELFTTITTLISRY